MTTTRSLESYAEFSCNICNLTFILFEEKQNMHNACSFILSWSQFWFDDQVFKNENFQNLLTSCKDFPKAASFVKRSSFIKTQPSDICAKRAVKAIQNL